MGEIGEAFKKPDFSGAETAAGNLWNQAMGEVTPSQGSIDQVAKMQNQMGNQAYNQGLTGSTMEQQALGQGETQAFDADQMKQAQQILGLTGGELAGQRQASMMPLQLLGTGLGAASQGLGAYEGGKAGGSGLGSGSTSGLGQTAGTALGAGAGAAIPGLPTGLSSYLGGILGNLGQGAWQDLLG